MLTLPDGYHCGFNSGFNTNESVNLAPDSWLGNFPKYKVLIISSASAKKIMFVLIP